LDERWKIVFATETGPTLEREQVIEQIMANSPTPQGVGIDPEPAKKDRGRTIVKDKAGNEYQVTGNLKNKIVVLQTNVQELNGGMVDVPNTANLQVYSKSNWQRLNDQNFFSESKIRTEILK
jgi:hypothetical protein